MIKANNEYIAKQWKYIECILNVHWIHIGILQNMVQYIFNIYILNGNWMYIECILNVHWMDIECTLNVYLLYINCPSKTFHFGTLKYKLPNMMQYILNIYILNGHWMYIECTLNEHCKTWCNTYWIHIEYTLYLSLKYQNETFF